MVKTKKTIASADGAVEKPEPSDNTSRDIKWYRHLEGSLAGSLKLNVKLVYDSASLLIYKHVYQSEIKAYVHIKTYSSRSMV